VSGNEGNTTLRLWSGVVAELTGDQKAAMAAYRKVLESNPDEAQALNNLAYLLAEQGNNIDEALKYAQRAVELAPERPAYCDTLGWILYRKGLYSLAIQYLEKADSNSKSVVSKYHLAMAYAKGGDRKRGQTTLAAALKVNPNVPEAQVARNVIGMPQ
jgi:tetratricopeptide (TPR) repeat protein